jgi:hypothetical protein
MIVVVDSAWEHLGWLRDLVAQQFSPDSWSHCWSGQAPLLVLCLLENDQKGYHWQEFPVLASASKRRGLRFAVFVFQASGVCALVLT